jgi:hypothetical protein
MLKYSECCYLSNGFSDIDAFSAGPVARMMADRKPKLPS